MDFEALGIAEEEFSVFAQTLATLTKRFGGVIGEIHYTNEDTGEATLIHIDFHDGTVCGATIVGSIGETVQ